MFDNTFNTILDFHNFNRLSVQTVQQRGAAVIKARKLSSAMSAAKAICDHMRDIWFGTKEVSERTFKKINCISCKKNHLEILNNI